LSCTLDHPDPIAEIQELIERHLASATVYELRETLYRPKDGEPVSHRHDVPMRRRGLSPEQVDEAIRRQSEGWSTYKISIKLDTDKRTVQRRLREQELRMWDAQGRERK
jgi:hypothetical protein